MDKSLKRLCEAIKKVIAQLKPQQNPLSFILITGKSKQGKSTLLKQSGLTQYPLDNEDGIKLFYNNQGVILKIGETWLTNTDNLLANSLKRLNRCHPKVKINGFILAVDSSELLLADPTSLMERCQTHTQFLTRFANALGYPVETAVFLTKLDALAGFCEFFQSEHVSELKLPMGFSIENTQARAKFLEDYKLQYDHMLDTLSQQIIHKLHPARSTIKRTLIREFPLQLASLRVAIQALLQNIPAQLLHLRAVYFTSAEQGGLSVDQLNKKIQHEYALTIQSHFAQSSNYRAYFIEGAIHAFQDQTKTYHPHMPKSHKLFAGLAAGLVTVSLGLITYYHFSAARQLDEASKELLTYETLINQTGNKTQALYHLTRADLIINNIPRTIFMLPVIERLKSQLHQNTQQTLQNNYLPDLLANLESVIQNPAHDQITRYQALKVYLMLGDKDHFSLDKVIDWTKQHASSNSPDASQDTELLLLKQALKQPMQPLDINQQVVSDARNYLNALPPAYLYYSLAKDRFPQDKTAIKVDGFSLATKELPAYYTKEGFVAILSMLPDITQQLITENWVLARQDLSSLQTLLEEAYCFEYVTWWQNFIKRSTPQHFQNYEQARALTQSLQQSEAFSQLITLIQDQTSPDPGLHSRLFNEKIASQFTSLNLMSRSAANELNLNIDELEKFLTTLSLINDNGHTVFELTKSRFEGDSLSDPLSALYARSKRLPEPVATWAKQIADDTWYLFINDSRQVLNQQWQQTVYSEYQNAISDRYPFEPTQQTEIALDKFDHFFAPYGTLNQFVKMYLKPFLDTSKPQWQAKDMNGYVMPISADLINELIRANVISNMFFPDDSETSKIDFTLQKINLDPVVANIQLTIGQTKLTDNQSSDSYTFFNWPQSDAKLELYSIEGNHYELAESGPWAFFKILQKVNVLVDSNDSSSLQILFEVNGNSGRYLLKTQNPINPFSPGILTGFKLNRDVA